jgi:hypothetical protein
MSEEALERAETHLTSILSALKGREEAQGHEPCVPSPPFRGEKDRMRWEWPRLMVCVQAVYLFSAISSLTNPHPG